MSLIIDIEKHLPTFDLKVKVNQDKGVLGFLGASGSGKSLTLKTIAGLDKPTKGKIIVNGTEFYNSNSKINLSPQKRQVGFLFQNYALFPNMTVSENIQIGLGKLKSQEKIKLCKEYIERLDLGGLEKHYPWQLSGGQQQRVALARALVISPKILLLDEPFSALDHHLRHSMEKELISILKDYNGNVIFVTHDIEEAFRVCDNIIVFDKGTALNNRNKIELFKAPKSYAEAKLTGCKNLSPAKFSYSNKIYAESWGYEYTVNSLHTDNISYVGIRAHHIELANSNNEVNSYPFIVENIIENPFDYTIYIKNPTLPNGDLISFSLAKKKLTFKISDIINVKFPIENLFYF
ncbi:ATP-binding cassette domain-containing protein [Clostridium saudiense]|nr:ATP-binding cassette domain-containing protein [Clostridium saudiense]